MTAWKPFQDERRATNYNREGGNVEKKTELQVKFKSGIGE